jgi:hypothetical protein
MDIVLGPVWSYTTDRCLPLIQAPLLGLVSKEKFTNHTLAESNPIPKKTWEKPWIL